MATDGDVEVRREAVIGYRAWSLIRGDLVSLTAPTRWPHYERMEAVHGAKEREHEDEPPCYDNLHCGIYAYRSPSDLARLEGTLAVESAVWGEVSLWGRLIRHEYAWRAQFAYPRLVIVRNELDAELVRRNYGCDVLVDDRVRPQPIADVGAGPGGPGGAPPAAQYAGAHPPTIPLSLVQLAAQFAQPGNGIPKPCVNLFVRGANGQQWTYSGVADTHAISEWLGGVMEFLILDGFQYGAGGQSQVMWGVQGFFQ